MENARVATVMVALALLAACSNDAAPPEPETTPLPTPEAGTPQPSAEPEAEVGPAADEEPDEDPADPDPNAEPTYSDRGNVVKEIGEMANLVNQDDEVTFRMRVTAVDTDPDCGSYVEDPVNGRFVALNIEAETTAAWPEEQFIQVTMHDFRAWTEDGMRVNDLVGEASSCDVANWMNPDPFHPSEKAAGVIVLDVPEEVWVAYEPFGDGGWEFFVE